MREIVSQITNRVLEKCALSPFPAKQSRATRGGTPGVDSRFSFSNKALNAWLDSNAGNEEALDRYMSAMEKHRGDPQQVSVELGV